MARRAQRPLRRGRSPAGHLRVERCRRPLAGGLRRPPPGGDGDPAAEQSPFQPPDRRPRARGAHRWDRRSTSGHPPRRTTPSRPPLRRRRHRGPRRDRAGPGRPPAGRPVGRHRRRGSHQRGARTRSRGGDPRRVPCRRRGSATEDPTVASVLSELAGSPDRAPSVPGWTRRWPNVDPDIDRHGRRGRWSARHRTIRTGGAPDPGADRCHRGPADPRSGRGRPGPADLAVHGRRK